MLAGVLVGFGYLTKMLQAFLIVPAPPSTSSPRRPHCAGDWASSRWPGSRCSCRPDGGCAIVELLPASACPYIGGSQTNSILELTFGYNGLGLTGEEVSAAAAAGGPGAGARRGLRLFNADNGGQIAWLLPAALILLVAGLIFTARAARIDRTRAAFLLWGGWLVVTAATFSLMAGIFHAYYDVALAPAIGALVGMDRSCLRHREPTTERGTSEAGGEAPAAPRADDRARNERGGGGPRGTATSPPA